MRTIDELDVRILELLQENARITQSDIAKSVGLAPSAVLERLRKLEAKGCSLVDTTCVINCGAGQCNSGVTCPAGRPCQVNCIGTGACETGVVNCLAATSCDITCDGTDACDAGINCAGTTCGVQCLGNAACEDGGVDCTAASCEILCDGNNTCRNHVCCTGTDCDSNQCQSTNGGCCDCQGCP